MHGPRAIDGKKTGSICPDCTAWSVEKILTMTRYCLKLLLLLLPVASPVAVSHADTKLVGWDTLQSEERLARSLHKVDFFPLSNHFVSQDNWVFCGLASSSIVLNALRLGRKSDLPQDTRSILSEELAWFPEGGNPFFGKYTPNNVLNSQTKSRVEILGKPIDINGELKRDIGLQLRQLAQVMRVHGLHVLTRVVHDDADAQVIRQELIRNLETRDDFILINYSRKVLGQKGGGHISPLGAYDEDGDSFLIMDVNPNSAPWVWVKADDLVAAMRTFDTIENRGYLLISES
ncbi:MAG: phytochelatin synthase [Gammaproteobacteria bacterium]|nr:phytochelatin synthase [Gammaproteobacteria bacterium]